MVKNRIYELRTSKNISQVQMAKDLGITRQTINAIEKHKYNPSLELSFKIVRYFGVSFEEVFQYEEGRRDEKQDQ